MYLSITVTPPEDTHYWRLLYKQIIDVNIEKDSYNNTVSILSISALLCKYIG